MTKTTGGTPWTERVLGFVGLFLIGLIGVWADRFGRSRQPEELMQRHVPKRREI